MSPSLVNYLAAALVMLLVFAACVQSLVLEAATSSPLLAGMITLSSFLLTFLVFLRALQAILIEAHFEDVLFLLFTFSLRARQID